MKIDYPVEEKIYIDRLGGMTNSNFKISTPDGCYVLRIPGKGTEEMIDRRNEKYNSYLSNQLNITPDIVYFDVESGIKLTPYMGTDTLNQETIQLSKNLEKIITNLRILHNSVLPFQNNFNAFREIEKYENILKKTGGFLYEGYSLLRPKIFYLAELLKRIGIESVPCHNDLVAENFVKSLDGKIYLIDWEYSGMNDPLWDLGALFVESNFTEENCWKALYIYYKGIVPPCTYTKILIYQIAMDILWSIWAQIKKIQGTDFGSYGRMRFLRAVKNVERLNL